MLPADARLHHELTKKLHYLTGFVSFRTDWHGVHAEVMELLISNTDVVIHRELLAVLAEMKQQVDNFGDFSNKLQDNMVAIINDMSPSGIVNSPAMQ